MLYFLMDHRVSANMCFIQYATEFSVFDVAPSNACVAKMYYNAHVAKLYSHKFFL